MAEKGASLRVRFGQGDVAGGFRGVTTTTALGEDAKAEVKIAVEAFHGMAADFRPMSALLDGDERVFVGWVGSVDLEDGVARISMRNGYQLEGRIDRLAISNGIQPAEMVWSIARIAGFPDEHLFIDGFKRVSDRFHVAMPVTGVVLDDERFGRVRLVRDESMIREALDFVKDQAWVGSLVANETWAIATVEAGTLFEAERVGVALIVATLDRLAVESQYSLASSPDGEVLPFRREGLFTDPQVVRVALVRAASREGRAWVRTLDQVNEPAPVANRRVGLVAPVVGEHAQFDEAIRAWRRSVTAADRIAAASAISEAIEFYVAGIDVSLAFAPVQIAALRDALCRAIEAEGTPLALTAPQRQRVDDMLGRLNEPSLKQQLLAALAADGVPYAKEEIDRVWRIRTARNNFVHGKSRDEPDDDDLDLGRAFVNRLIVWWGRSIRIRDGAR
jgi:hypothetical protein